MNLVCLRIRMELCSDAIFGSGNSVPGGEDVALRLDGEGNPFLPGSTLKGLLRESMANYLCWTGRDTGILNELFGEEGWNGGENSPDLTGGRADDSARGRRLIFGDLRLAGDPSDWAGTRSFTALEDNIVKSKMLRTATCLRKGLEFRGELLCDKGDVELVQSACAGLKWAGLLRHRGFGRIRVTAEQTGHLRHKPAVEQTNCIRYRLELATPMTVPRFSRSTGDWSTLNYIDTKKYLPGSAVRGLIVSTLARERPEWFLCHKSQLLGNGVRFLNALPVSGEQATIPTPMGFYEDKGNTRFYSVLMQDVYPGDKRASIGAFCTIDGDLRMTGYTPKTAVSLRIRRGNSPEEKQIFAANSIAAGTVLEGFIQLDDPSLAPDIAAAFYDWAWLGADKYAGNGLCRVACVEPAQGHYGEQYSFGPGDTVPEQLYMMLLSPASMSQDGESAGINEEGLADLLELPQPTDGMKRLTVDRCVTSVTEHVSYNSTWGCASATEVMYEAGSVFRLRCACAPTLEALWRLEKMGIGLRRGEGCGQVLFLKDYERFTKCQEEPAAFQPDPEALVRQARCRWLLEHPVPGEMSKSQLGSVQVLCERAMALGGDLSGLKEYFTHNLTERGARHGARFEGFQRQFERLIQTPLAETLCVANCPDGVVERLKLICDWLDLSRKEAG